jgi:hypothetical protein
LRCPVKSLNPYIATLIGGPSGAGNVLISVVIVPDTTGASLSATSPIGRTVLHAASAIATVIVNKDSLKLFIICP